RQAAKTQSATRCQQIPSDRRSAACANVSHASITPKPVNPPPRSFQLHQGPEVATDSKKQLRPGISCGTKIHVREQQANAGAVLRCAVPLLLAGVRG
ncbi:hypothetical protein NDU88_000736, partial [Pleurodeles waltl]